MKNVCVSRGYTEYEEELKNHTCPVLWSRWEAIWDKLEAAGVRYEHGSMERGSSFHLRANGREVNILWNGRRGEDGFFGFERFEDGKFVTTVMTDEEVVTYLKAWDR